MDVASFLSRWTWPVILVVAIIGIIYIAFLGFKYFRASEPSVAIETKKQIFDVATGFIMTIIFIAILSIIVRAISRAIYWP